MAWAGVAGRAAVAEPERRWSGGCYMCQIDGPIWCPAVVGAAAPGDERGGLDDDERVEADVVSKVNLRLATLHF